MKPDLILVTKKKPQTKLHPSMDEVEFSEEERDFSEHHSLLCSAIRIALFKNFFQKLFLLSLGLSVTFATVFPAEFLLPCFPLLHRKISAVEISAFVLAIFRDISSAPEHLLLL